MVVFVCVVDSTFYARQSKRFIKHFFRSLANLHFNYFCIALHKDYIHYFLLNKLSTNTFKRRRSNIYEKFFLKNKEKKIFFTKQIRK